MTEESFKNASDALKKLGITEIKVGRSMEFGSIVVECMSNGKWQSPPYNGELYHMCLNVYIHLQNKHADKINHERLMEKEYNDFFKQCDPTELPW